MTIDKQVQKPIIFFDGVCGMCNAFVNLILLLDRNNIFLFAPLQGVTAKKLLPPLANDACEWSMVYVNEAGIHDQSDALLEISRKIGGILWLFSLTRYMPRFVRNFIYRVIARNRYRWLGKRNSCRIITAEEQKHFLP